MKLKFIDLTTFQGEVVIDMLYFSRNTGRVELFAALVIINAIRAFLDEAELYGIKVRIQFLREENLRNTYAKTLRLYSSLGLPIGQKPNEDNSGLAQSTEKILCTVCQGFIMRPPPKQFLLELLWVPLWKITIIGRKGLSRKWVWRGNIYVSY